MSGSSASTAVRDAARGFACFLRGSRATATDVRAALHLHADPLVHGAADCLSKSAPDEMAIEAGFLVMEEEQFGRARRLKKFIPKALNVR